MSRSLPARDAHHALRQLTSTHALDFCSRLLSQSNNGVFTFREFVKTTHDMIRDTPAETATFLAALAAPDIDLPEVIQLRRVQGAELVWRECVHVVAHRVRVCPQHRQALPLAVVSCSADFELSVYDLVVALSLELVGRVRSSELDSV